MPKRPTPASGSERNRDAVHVPGRGAGESLSDSLEWGVRNLKTLLSLLLYSMTSMLLSVTVTVFRSTRTVVVVHDVPTPVTLRT